MSFGGAIGDAPKAEVREARRGRESVATETGHAPLERVPRAAARGSARGRLAYVVDGPLLVARAPAAKWVDAPLPHRAHHVAHAVRARPFRKYADRQCAARPDAAHAARVVAPIVAPGILSRVGSPRRLLPFGFARQPGAPMRGERLCFEEAHADDGMVGDEVRRPFRFVPKTRFDDRALGAPRPALVAPIAALGISIFADESSERGNRDGEAVDRVLGQIDWSRRVAHREGAGGDDDGVGRAFPIARHAEALGCSDTLF